METRKNRNNSNSQERRNSVSDIKEFFNKPTKAKDKDKVGNKTKQTEKKSNNSDKQGNDQTPNKPNSDNAINANNPRQSQSANKQGENDEHDNCEVSGNNIKEKDAETNCNPEDNEEVKAKEQATQTGEDAILRALEQLQTEVKRIDTDVNDPKNGVVVQLAKTSGKVEDLYTDIHGAVDGLKAKMNQVTESAANNLRRITSIESGQTRMASLLAENKRLLQELKIMQGLVQKVSQHSIHTADQVIDLTRRGMEQNLILHGVDDSLESEFFQKKKNNALHKGETLKDCYKITVANFLKEMLNVDIQIEDIWKAHRTGPFKANKVRPLVVKLSYAAKDLVMEHVAALKGKKNPNTQQTYFISEQLPDGVTEVRKQTSARMKTITEINERKPPHERSKIQLINNKIMIDGEISAPEVEPPTPLQLFPDPEAQRRIDQLQMKLVETEIHHAKNSQFIALAAKAHSIQEVNQLYIAAAQRYPDADHIMAAYALKEKGSLRTGAVDDREYGAANKIRNIIFETKAKNTVTFVVRRFGGLHLGQARFAAIEKVTHEALQLLENSL